MMELNQLLALIFISTTLVAILVLGILSRRSNTSLARIRNIASRTGDTAPVKNLITKNGTGEEERKSFAKRFIMMFGMFSQRNKQQYSKLKLMLLRAGFFSENSIRVFMSLKVWTAVILFLICIVPWLFLGESAPPAQLIVLLLPLPFIGYAFPNIVLKSKIRRRQDEIARGLPDALDFLVVCVEAGLGLNAALIRVGQELQLRCRALGEELILVNQEMRTGISREQSLRNLSHRNPIEDLKILVGSLVLADRLGSSISTTLRVQSDSLRTRVRQRCEEKAAQSGIKMLFPLVFFILPALFIVIMGPGVILTLKNMVN
jgi:tight adherence protein C